MALALAACSGSNDADGAADHAGGAADHAGGAADGAGGAADGAGGAADGTPTPDAAHSPESFAEYYRKLGVAEPVVTCYVGALTDLGVTSLDQLEADQELGARAADRFDRCVVDVGGGAGTPTT